MNPIVAKRDVGLAIFIIAVCIAAIAECWNLPPGTFEPLGSGPIPIATASIVIGLCLIILARAVVTLVRHRAYTKTTEELTIEAEDAATGFRPRPFAAVVVLALGGLYVGALYFGIVGFGTVTTLFLLLIMLYLIGPVPWGALHAFATTGDRSRLAEARPILIALVIAVIMGYGCEVVFTRIFYVDLPTG